MRACQVGNNTLFDSLLDICDIHAVCTYRRNALYYAVKSLNTINIKVWYAKVLISKKKICKDWHLPIA